MAARMGVRFVENHAGRMKGLTNPGESRLDCSKPLRQSSIC
jgi:hypothetical protein